MHYLTYFRKAIIYSLAIFSILIYSSFTYAAPAGPGWMTQGDGFTIQQPADKGSEQLREDAFIQQEVAVQAAINPDQLASFISPEIAELARGLQYDPKLIYDYVHNHIDYVPYFGSLKGATLTYLDRSGNDFDQASLMIALLRASGYTTAQYVFGSMTIPYADLANWLGVDNDGQIIGTVLFAGGFYSGFNYFYTDSAQIHRVWVRATINNSVYDLDPAFKAYQGIPSVFEDTGSGMINLDDDLLYDRNTFIAEAQTGSTEIGDDWVKNLNYTALANNLETYSLHLIDVIRQQYPNHSLDEIIGGRNIVQSTLLEYPSDLPYPYSVWYVWDEINWDYISRLNIMHGDCGNSWDIFIDLYTHELSGKRLTLTYSESDNRPELRIDGVVKASGQPTLAGIQCDMKIKIFHPYESDYGDQDATYTIESGRSYAIVYNFGGTAESLLQKRHRKLDTYRAQGLDDLSEEVMGESLNIMGMTWMKQVNMTDDVLSALAGTVNTRHHKIGVMAQEAGYFIDVPQSFVSITSKHGIVEDKRSHFKVSALIYSSFEHGILEQLMGKDNPGISTTKIFQIANTEGQKIFYLDKGNFVDIKDQLNYDPDLIDDGDPSTRNDFKSLTDDGYTLILPQSDDVGINQWSGTGYITKKIDADGGHIGMIINGGYDYYGGYNSTQGNLCTYCVSDSAFNTLYTIPSPSTSLSSNVTVAPRLSKEPVDMASGAYIFESTDLTLGGAAPRGLSFSRFYSSNNYLENRTLGNGWTHNYDIFLNRHSSGDPGLGGRQPVDSAALISQTYVALDLMKHLDSDTTSKQEKLLGWTISSLAAKWAVDQLVDNAVTVHVGRKLLQFIKLPDDTYSSPPGVTTELIDNGDSTFSLLERFGTRLDFDSNDRISQMMDIDGNALIFAYNGDNLWTVTDAFDRSLTFQYYTNGLIEKVTDSTGRFVSYGYTGDDLTIYTDPENKEWKYGYNDPAHPHYMTSLTNPLLDITATNTYDSLGRVMEQTVPRQTQNATYYFYFSGFRNFEEDPDGETIVYYFDKKGRPIGEMNQLLHETSRKYDGQFHVVSVTDPLRHETIFQYDGNQNLISTTNALLKSTYFKYDPDFDYRLTDTIDPLNHGTHIEYDSEHHPELSRFGVLYNANQVPVDSGIFQTGATYYPDGHLHDGLTETTTDGRSTVTRLIYDTYGNPQTAITGSHDPLITAFDPIGLMTSLTNQEDATTTFPEYNNRGQLKRRRDPLLMETELNYDDAGQLENIIDRNGDKFYYSYTPAGKVDTITYKDPFDQIVSTVSFVYDLHDDLREMHDSVAHTNYVYDAAHQLKTSTLRFNGESYDFIVSYGYDDAGNLTSLTYPGNKTVTYTYDPLNRLKTVTIDWLNPQPVATYHYDDVGKLDWVDNFNGTVTDYDYDNANRLTDLENKRSDTDIIAEYHFTLDGNGNREQVTNTEPIMPMLTSGTSTYTYNQKKNRLETLSTGQSFDYDDEGQLSLKGSTTYAFDHEHRLNSVQQSGDNYQYYYDGIGNRLKVDRNGEITKYIYDAGGNLLAEADGNDNITAYYIHGLGLMAMVTPAGDVYTYHFDAVGNTIAMTDENKLLVNAYSYTPFGIITNQVDNISQPFKYVGQYGVMTEDNGMYYMRARYYDPEVGRFISEDPIGFDGGDVNLMAYVQNNPVNLVDPSGRAAFWYHFADGYRAGRAMDQGIGASLKLGWATMMPDFNNLKTTPWAHATTDNQLVSPQVAKNNALDHATASWNTGTMDGQATAIHIWRDVVSHKGSYFPNPASVGDYASHIVQYDLLPGGSFQDVIGSRMNNPKP